MQRIMFFLSILVVLGGALTAQVPDYEIGVPPVQVVQSWYNYMPSGYYDLPLFQFPLAQGGGASFIYHACVDQPTAVRRIYTAYFNSLGQPIPVTMPWQDENRNMGFPSLAFDPTINRTLYSWHENSDTDTANEVVFVHESDPIQNPGLFSNRFVVFNPTTLPPGHETDEFLWPSIKIGTSPDFWMCSALAISKMPMKAGFPEKPSETSTTPPMAEKTGTSALSRASLPPGIIMNFSL